MGEIEEEYLRNHPEEIDDYITVLFDEYAESGDTATLLSSLLVVSCVKGNCDRKKGDLNMPVVKGIKKGKTIVLLEDLNLPDGQEVLVEVTEVNDFWSSLQDFRKRVDLETIDDDTFKNLRDKSTGRDISL